MFEMVHCIKTEEEAKRIAVDMIPCVELRCSCTRFNIVDVPLDKFETITDKYCVLKDGVEITCPKCGNIHTEKFIPLEDQRSGTIPKCPTCGSIAIEKISKRSKLIGYATLGVFSSNFGKQFRCKNCGYKF